MKHNLSLNSNECWACRRSEAELKKLGVRLLERTTHVLVGGDQLEPRDVLVCEVCNHITE